MTAFVYRCFDETGGSLYVGASVNVDARLATHELTTTWGPAIHRVESTKHDTMRDALDHEQEEIRRLRPRWNINGRGPRVGWGLVDYVEVILAVDARRHLAWKPENSDRKIVRLAGELSRRFPDIATRVLADLTPHVPALTAVA